MLDEFFTIFLIDNILCKPLQKIFTIIDNKTRWFLLHSIINFIIVRYSFNDLVTCIIYDEICYKIKWNNESIITYNFAVFFFNI